MTRRRTVPAAAALLAALIVLGAGGGAPAAAATPEALFESAGGAYRSGDYQAAARDYEQILAYGIADPRVLYNLGNTYFKMGRLGEAILQYERALRLDPSDEWTRYNLNFARGRIRDRVEEPELQYPIRVVKDTLERLPKNPLAWTFLVLWVGAGACVGAWPWVRSWGRRRLLAGGAIALGLLSLTTGAALGYKILQDRTDAAIVLQDKVDVRSGPGKENTVLFTVHEGTRMELHNRLDSWLQVSLPNGLSGWVPSASVEKV